jgi:hypothetical protein
LKFSKKPHATEAAEHAIMTMSSVDSLLFTVTARAMYTTKGTEGDVYSYLMICVNFGPLQFTYEWEGKIDSCSEAMMSVELNVCPLYLHHTTPHNRAVQCSLVT